HGIGSENHGGTGNACALYGREAHTTQAHDEHGGTCFYFSRVENSADTGLQGAASEAGQLEGNILVDFDGGFGGEHHLFCKSGYAETVVNLFPVTREGRAAVRQGEQLGARGILAEGKLMAL